MTKTINWMLDFKETLGLARTKNKAVLLDFFKQHSIGYQQMGAVMNKSHVDTTKENGSP